MGIFGDLKDMTQAYRSDELKQIRGQAKAMPRTSMMDALRAGAPALEQATQMQGALTNGAAGTATIHSVVPTGAVVGQNPVFAFDLTISLPDRPSYRTEHSQMVSPMAMGTFQPGATVPVRVGVDDPGSIFLGA